MKNARDFFSVEEIGGLAEGVLGGDAALGRLRLLQVSCAWGRAVGKHLRGLAHPASYSARALVVDVPDTRWKRELDRLEPEIRSRLARLLPSHPIQGIVFRVRRCPGPVVARRSPCAPQPDATDRGRGDTLADQEAAPLQSVPDRDLRERLSRVMGRYLAAAR